VTQPQHYNLKWCRNTVEDDSDNKAVDSANLT